MTNELFSGYVLAGGKSSRMKKNKAFLEIEGETFLARAVKTLSAVCQKPVRVVLKTQQVYMTDRFPENAEAIYDATDFESPLDGLHKALMDAFMRKTKFAVVLAVDLPFVTGSVIEKLAETIQSSNKFLAVVPRQADGKPQPLAAVYNAKYCFYALQNYLEKTPNGSVRDFLETISTRYVDQNKLSENEKVFFNINYPADFELLSN